MVLVFYDARSDKIFELTPNLWIERTYYKTGGLKKISIEAKLKCDEHHYIVFLGLLYGNHSID